MSEHLDISDTIIPRSDQPNYDDVAAVPIVATITKVQRGSVAQPVELHLEGYEGRPFKPSKSMRRVLVAAWGKDASQYVGRTIGLYGDPTVLWAGKPVGGIRIKALSHLDRPLKTTVTVNRKQREPFTVEPLTVPAPASPTVSDEQIESASLDELRGLWGAASPTQKARIQERAQQLETGDPQ